MKNRPRKGFSLIELLIASVVVASAGALLIGGLVTANRSAQIRIDQTLATQLLASQLALLDDQFQPKTPRQGSMEPPLEDDTWALEWSETPWTPLVEAKLSVSHKGQAVDAVTYRPFTEP